MTLNESKRKSVREINRQPQRFSLTPEQLLEVYALSCVGQLKARHAPTPILSPTPTHRQEQKDPPQCGPINVTALCSSLSGYMKCL